MRFSENRVIKLPDRNRGALPLTLGSEISARSIPVGGEAPDRVVLPPS